MGQRSEKADCRGVWDLSREERVALGGRVRAAATLWCSLHHTLAGGWAPPPSRPRLKHLLQFFPCFPFLFSPASLGPSAPEMVFRLLLWIEVISLLSGSLSLLFLFYLTPDPISGAELFSAFLLILKNYFLTRCFSDGSFTCE